jgi:hypothetical protein
MARRKRITGLRFTPHTVSFRMDGEPVWDRVEISPRVPMVGHFDLSRPVVRVDRKITDPRERRAVILHEAVERELRAHQGLGPLQAHRVAEATEAHAGQQLGMSPHDTRRYSRHVEQVFRENAREGVRRRR